MFKFIAVCLFCLICLPPYTVAANGVSEISEPILLQFAADETPAPKPTNTPRPTLSIFPEEGENGQDAIELPETDPKNAPENDRLSEFQPPRVRVADLFGYGLILIGVGLIWMFLTQRNQN